MRFSGWCGLGLASMVATAACSSSEHAAPQGPSGEAGSGVSAGTGPGGSGGSGGSAEAGRAGASGQAGTMSGGGDGVGSGELDASCRERTTNHVAGSEIGLRERVTAEGDRVFAGFYDKKSGEDCTFVEDADGVTRCFPPVDAFDSRFFLDAACEQRVEYRGICSGDRFAIPVSDDPCETRHRVYAYGAPKAAAVVWERDASGACREYGQIDSLYERGAELPAGDYPIVKDVTWRGLGRVARVGYEGAGGLQIVRWFRDGELGERCTSKVLADGKSYCAPFDLGSFQLTDQSCSKTLLGTKASCDAPTPKYGAARSSQSCLGDTYVEHGEAFSGALYTRSSCQPASAASTEGWQVSSAKVVPPERFAATEAVVDESDEGRLKPVYDTTSDGGCWFHGWFDTEQDAPCDFQATNDQKYRCVPPTVQAPDSVIELFTDAGCTELVTYYATSCAAATVPKLVTRVLAQSCTGNAVEVRPVMAAVPQPLPPRWWQMGGTCQSYPYGAGSTFYELGEPLPLDSFVAAE